MKVFRLTRGSMALPKSTLVAPGATNTVLVAGEEFSLPDSAVDRFIRRRLETGDLVEVTTKKEG